MKTLKASKGPSKAAAALAKARNCELVTGAPEFQPLKMEIKNNWLKG